jgi:hypothetical protein
VDVLRVTPIQTTSKSVTTAYQKAVAGTPWQYYELVGVQFPVNPVVNKQVVGTAKGNGAQISDCYLANVTMESFVQSTSCVTCHSYGARIARGSHTTRPRTIPLAGELPDLLVHGARGEVAIARA